MKSHSSKQIESSGQGFTSIKSQSVSFLPPPVRFQNFVRCITAQAIDKSLCDTSEAHYIDVWVSENNYGDNVEKYWELFTLQEKKVIHTLSDNQIAPYIAYRRSFKDGASRYQYTKKPVFILIELASAYI